MSSNSKVLPIIVLLVAHIPLGVIVYKVPILATLHALLVSAIGLRWALRSKPDLVKVACVGAYITGSEVIWRMSEAQIFWEYGKYATAALFIVALLRGGHSKIPVLGMLFFALLVPSTIMIIADQGLWPAKYAVSFNMSGPFSLMVAIWFFSNLTLTRAQLQQVFLTLLLPLVSTAFITLFVTVRSDQINFGTGSSRALSAGFGPNQVSAALGLGFLVAFLVFLFGERLQAMRVLLFAVMLFLGAQSLMTFSRAGMYNAVGASIFASFFLLRDTRTLPRLIMVAALGLAVGVGIVLPRMNEFSGGALFKRFQDTDMTHRESFVELDLEIWAANPVLGIGPGEAKSYRRLELGRGQPSHTEFTRLLSEHGSFGLAALLLLIAAGLSNLVRARGAQKKALAVAAMGWSCLYMTNAGMRLVAPAFMFGLAFITLLPDTYSNFAKLRSVTRNFKPRLGRGGAALARPVERPAMRQGR